MDNLLADPARAAILGPGGIGKTALAVTVLHSMKVVEKYPIRHFPCDSVQTNNSLVATIGSHLGLEGSQSSTRHIVHHLTMQPPTLLILDNFETPWEPADGRVKVEEFLALLADIPHVGLLVQCLLVCHVFILTCFC
jgi:CO dehydrogenase nickel-insertion accessory protein CooC1